MERVKEVDVMAPVNVTTAMGQGMLRNKLLEERYGMQISPEFTVRELLLKHTSIFFANHEILWLQIKRKFQFFTNCSYFLWEII